MILEHFKLLADYNQWANKLLYGAVATIGDKAYFADRKAFFGSIHRTLNHILVGDRIWLQRFTGKGDAPDQLDVILYNDFMSLQMARIAEDERILEIVNGFDESALKRNLGYRNTAGTAFETPMAPLLDHFFNHQTHHRGQVHDMLCQTGMKPPQLDLLGLIRERLK
jgi:uncharacterized damage-inducible protein DinB